MNSAFPQFLAIVGLACVAVLIMCFYVKARSK